MPVPMVSVKSKVFHSAFWLFSLRAVQVLGEFARLIILARLLSPADFGLAGMALLTLATLEIFSEPGLQHALVRKHETDPDALSAAWSVSVLRGIGIAAALFFAAPWAALLFQSAEAAPLIQACGLVGAIKCFSNIGVVLFEKELDFKKVFQYQFLSSVLSILVAIVWACSNPSPWAIIGGFMAGNLTTCIMSYRVSSFRPVFKLHREKLASLWSFGKWMLGSNILLFAITQSDQLVVATLLGSTALGYYQIALKIAGLPQSEFSHLISRISFPSYSKLQHDLERLSNAFARVLGLGLVVCLPLTSLIVLLAEDFVLLFLGERWLNLVPPLKILAFCGLLRALASPTGALFMAIGKPAWRTRLQALQLLILLLLIIPLTNALSGIAGTALAVLCAGVSVEPAALVIAFRLTRTSLKRIVKPVLLALSIALVFIFIKQLVLIAEIESGLCAFAATVLLCGAVEAWVLYHFVVKPEFPGLQLFKQQVDGSQSPENSVR